MICLPLEGKKGIFYHANAHSAFDAHHFAMPSWTIRRPFVNLEFFLTWVLFQVLKSLTLISQQEHYTPNDGYSYPERAFFSEYLR
jgi:hypothetical protein